MLNFIRLVLFLLAVLSVYCGEQGENDIELRPINITGKILNENMELSVNYEALDRKDEEYRALEAKYLEMLASLKENKKKLEESQLEQANLFIERTRLGRFAIND